MTIITLYWRTLRDISLMYHIFDDDGAKPHQARMVMEWLDTIFQDRMLAIKCLRGDTWAPYSPDCNPCDYFLWGYMKEKVYHPLPANMTALKRKIKVEFGKIPELMVQKSIMNMKKRGALMVGLGVSSLRGGGKLLNNRAVKYVIH